MLVYQRVHTKMQMSQQEDAEGKKNNIKNQDSKTFPNQSIKR